jgi:hypothetical protein
MPWSQADLSEYMRKELAYYENPNYHLPDRVLAIKIVQCLRGGLVRLSLLPSDDPFWDGTNGVPTLFKLGGFCRMILSQNPDDEEVQWALVANAMHCCDNDFGRDQLELLVERNATHSQWLVAGALWVWALSGFDTTSRLRESLGRLADRIADFDDRLLHYAASRDLYLSVMARAGLKVREGMDVPTVCPLTLEALP